MSLILIIKPLAYEDAYPDSVSIYSVN